jgi:hypothetical protein
MLTSHRTTCGTTHRNTRKGHPIPTPHWLATRADHQRRIIPARVARRWRCGVTAKLPEVWGALAALSDEPMPDTSDAADESTSGTATNYDITALLGRDTSAKRMNMKSASSATSRRQTAASISVGSEQPQHHYREQQREREDECQRRDLRRHSYG